MALPAVAAAAAKGAASAGQTLGKLGKGMGQIPGLGGVSPETASEEEGEDEETGSEAAARKAMAILSPEGIAMLTVAGLLDFVGAFLLILDILFGIGEIISYIPDAVGMILFGLWVYFRNSREKTLKETMGEMKERVGQRRQERKQMVQAAKKGLSRGMRFGLSALGELLPLIGAIPFWTIFVYQELTSKKE